MNVYEKTVSEISTDLVIEDQIHLRSGTKGYYTNEVGIDLILIDKDATTKEKLCILMEELGHYYTTYGDITDQSKTENRKQERKARAWGYERLVSISKLVSASDQGIRNRYELAEYLDVTEEFLENALKYYKEKYGTYYNFGSYRVYFNPLWVYKNIE